MSAKLYGANVCPFVHRVRLLLAEKGVEHDYVAIDLANKPDWYHEVLPTGKVPLMEHNGHRIWESDVLCEYVEEAFEGKNYLPDDPGLKAKVRILVGWGGTNIVPLFYKLLASQDEEKQSEFTDGLLKKLAELDSLLSESEGPFFLPQITLADLELYPWFERLCVLEHYRGFKLPPDLVHVNRWKSAMSERAAVQSLREPDDFFIQQYNVYASGDRIPA